MDSGHRQVVTGCQSPGLGSLLLMWFLESSAAPLFVICFPEFPCLRPLSVISPPSQVSPLFRKNSPARKAPCNRSPDTGPRGPCGNSAPDGAALGRGWTLILPGAALDPPVSLVNISAPLSPVGRTACLKHCEMRSWGASDSDESGFAHPTPPPAACILGSTNVFVHRDD